jgi:hypothetical protein
MVQLPITADYSSRYCPRVRCMAWALALFVGGLLSGSAAAVELTDKTPTGVLEVREHPTTAPIYRAACEAYDDSIEQIGRFVELRKQGKLKSAKLLPLGQAYVRTLQLRRYSDRLVLLGEPAGFDLLRRQNQLQQQMRDLIHEYSMLPGVSEQIGKGFSVLKRESDKRLKKTLPQVKKLKSEEKWQEANDAALEVLDDLYAMGAFYAPETWPFKPLADEHGLLESDQVRRLILDAGVAEAQAAQEAQRPAYDELLKNLTAAATSIGMSGLADVGGESLDGPAAVRRFGEAWKQVHLRAIQCQAYDWAQQAVRPGSLKGSETVAASQAFDSSIRAGLAGLIGADAQRSSVTDAEALYPRYLAELSAILAMSSELAPTDPILIALDHLAAKSPTLSTDVAAYRAVTSDLLIWRRRAARAQAKSHAAKYAELEERFWQESGVENSKFGLDARNGTYKFAPALIKSGPEVITLADQSLKDQSVSVSAVLGPRLQGSSPLSQVTGATFARLQAADPQPTAIAELEQDLLVATGRDALTLQAAWALEGARRGDFESAGGVITGSTMLAAAPQMSKASDADWGMVRLGPLVAPQSDADFGRRVLLRFDVKADWLQNQHYFVELPNTVPLTQADASR